MALHPGATARSVDTRVGVRTRSDPEAALPSKEHVLGIGAEGVVRGGHIRRSRRFGARSGSVGQGMNVNQRAQVELGTEQEIPEN
jgi:hypothetical protein